MLNERYFVNGAITDLRLYCNILTDLDIERIKKIITEKEPMLTKYKINPLYKMKAFVPCAICLAKNVPLNDDDLCFSCSNRASTPEQVTGRGPSENDMIKRAVNPNHYKSYIDELEWLDAMSKIPTLRNPERFKAALELQIRKYLDRNGQKDDGLQELRKCRFYLQYLIKYIENGNSFVSAKEVHKSLEV